MDDDFYTIMFPPYTGNVKIGEFYYDLYIDQDTLERTAEVIPAPTEAHDELNYKDLTVVRIPASVIYHEEEYIVTGIGKMAFSECGMLNTVELPDTITNIGYGAFQYCMALTSINLPAKVTCIEGMAFFGCWDLFSIVLPDSLTCIGEEAFECCIEFTSIVIPASVSSIKKEAFGGCNGLVDITCKASVPPSLGDNVFREVNKSIPLYVPIESIYLYKSAPQWCEFTNINCLQAIKNKELFVTEPDPTPCLYGPPPVYELTKSPLEPYPQPAPQKRVYATSGFWLTIGIIALLVIAAFIIYTTLC